MEAAGHYSYVSKNFLQEYSKKKQKRQAKKQEPKPEEKEAMKTIKEEKAICSDSGSDSGSDKGNRSVLSVCEADLCNELAYSDDENFQMDEAPKKEAGKVYHQEVDVNVFKINFSTLKDAGELATGDPLFCKTCQAAFNIYSKVEENKREGFDSQVWICEFCQTINEVNLEPEEKPKSSQVNYILEAAAQVKDSKKMTNQDITVVFAIDISGSMCVSKQIMGKHSIKGDKTKNLQDLMKFSDGSDQRLQGESNVTYISRMQCVQAAIDNQLSEMAIGAPDRKLGIVTFNHEVTIIGDGSKTSQVITGDKLNDYDFLLLNGMNEGSQRLQKTIDQTKDQLQKKVMELEETGPTALGPALVTAVAMASDGAPGSTVILCTDGLANVGLGAFDEIKTEDQSKKVDEFYERLGQFAKEKGITVSIISIEGEECNIDTLSKIAELTGGNVDRVDPIQLTQNFSNILQLPVIATNVVTKVKLHKGLEFRNEDPANLSEDKSLMVRELGNVTEETEITFEYRLKAMKELVKMEDIDLTQIQSFPFQAQITYMAMDGSKCIRIISNQQAISSDREELEKNANYQILSTNAIQQSSKLAKKGQMVEAQVVAKTWKRKMRDQISNDEQMQDYQKYNKHFGEVYNMINDEKIQEKEYESDDEESKHDSGKQKKGFFGKLGDKISAKLYNASKINKKKFDM